MLRQQNRQVSLQRQSSPRRQQVDLQQQVPTKQQIQRAQSIIDEAADNAGHRAESRIYGNGPMDLPGLRFMGSTLYDNAWDKSYNRNMIILKYPDLVIELSDNGDLTGAWLKAFKRQNTDKQ